MPCPHCGQPLPEPRGPSCPHCGHQLAPSGAAQAAQDAVEAARRVADGAGRAVQSVLEDPSLRKRLPGGSLPLLGAGFVAVAVLLPVLPFFSGVLGLPWSVVMLAGSVLLGARELSAAGRRLPPPLEKLADVASHPVFLPVFTGLTVTHAYLTFAIGLSSLAWLCGAVVLGYVQWRAFKASPASVPDLPRRPGETRLKSWVLAGAAVCVLSLALPWTSTLRGGFSLGTLVFETNRTYDVDQYGRSEGTFTDENRSYFRPGTTFTRAQLYAVSGRSRTGATLAMMGLLAAGLLATVRRARAAVPPLTFPALALFLTLWGLAGLASRPGPWLYLLGVLALDVAVMRDYLQSRDASTPAPPTGTGGSDPAT